MDRPEGRLPLPSEDGGDLVDEPASGLSDDPMVATEVTDEVCIRGA